ncbi:stage III sporulation protein AA [Halobacillus karajensis]|uniref:Stage III sporulation protein AA n=1 Tax=Halobacillus karajensis TaxID=195088 RepID=A0A024P7I6_9BACI|nr:stage III sporulation protein AA [Halobacillus karajensis]CDQ17906.1 stage III sporulation protein AA [Halobacillus karajensis]CDQ24312.1 stage III sporulation protein AA [Halobacillus karajensis]CDQ29439.1 stage III sporulation protein AA [Halobacillus karajensis]
MKEIIRLFPPSIQRLLKKEVCWKSVQEIRLRIGRSIEVLESTQYRSIHNTGMTAENLSFVLNQISQFSLYRFKDELKEGFITIEGGHRVGLAGKANTHQDHVETLKHISFMNIRVAKSTPGQVKQLIPYLNTSGQWLSTMVIGPPHSGKTTLLREIARYIGSDNPNNLASKVAIVDERSEIAASTRGVPQLDVGFRTDVMDACPKAEGMMMMIRSMSPEVLVVDEIGGMKDAEALREATYTGVEVICSVHGHNFASVKKRPSVKQLIEEEVFKRYIVLDRLSPENQGGCKVLDQSGQALAQWKGRDLNAVDRSGHHIDRHYMGRV